MDSSSEDQRQHPRVPLTLQVDYPEREGYLADATENLSAGGAFIRTDRALQVGDRLPMVFSFAGLIAPVEVMGVVAWVRPAGESQPGGVGVRIPEEHVEDRRKLEDLMRRISAPLEAPGPRTYKVLLVEDNPHITELYEYVMKKLARSDELRVDVAVAKEGYEALAMLEKQPYDLVITDLYMPVLDGFELIQRLRSAPGTRDLPIIAISAGGRDAQVQAQKAGASVFLRKPVRFGDVLETVRTLLLARRG